MRLLCCDGTNAVMRVATVATDLTPTAVALTATKRILRACKDLQATHLIVALDSTTNWRYEVYPDYKGAVKAPSGLSTAPFSLALGEALEARGVKVMAHKGFEADDILATVAKRIPAPNECLLLSSDNDLLQVLQPHVKLFQYAAKGETPWLVERTAEFVTSHFGVPVSKYPAYLALVGGKNKVPGIAGIGPKRAAKLLVDSDLAVIIAEGKIPTDKAAWLQTAVRLHTLSTDVPIATINPKECRVPTWQGVPLE